MNLKNVETITNILNASPIRKYLKNKNNDISIFENEEKVLSDIDNIIQKNKNNLNNKLKVVIMGEVKAGKSTLVNYLVGKKVSFTNVIEATASILEIKYSQDEEIVIKRKDGKELTLKSIDELNRIVGIKEGSKDLIESIDLITIKIDIERLKTITIVDTPGLNTITRDNEEITENYIVNADLVLWVLNSNHLGQSDVDLKIEEVMEYGKPIIGVLNRIDEVDGDYLELINYVECEMGYMFKDIFAVSAKTAWDGYLENSNLKIEESKINSLNEYLECSIEKNADDIKIESALESINSQITRDLYTHKEAYNKLRNVLEKINKDYEELNNFNHKCKLEIDNKLDEWINRKFLQEERDELVRDYKMFNFKNEINEKLNDEILKCEINAIYESLSNHILQQWINNAETINRKESELNINYINSKDISDITNEEEVLKGSIKGGVAGGSAAVALASYSAWLGPAAASVSIGSALVTFVPPLLIAGIVAGSVWKLTGADENHKRNKIDKMISNIKNSVKKDIYPKMIYNLHNISDHYMNICLKDIESIITKYNTSKEEIESMSEDIDKYIRKVDDFVRNNQNECESKIKFERNKVIN